ncbi:hypothetical protein HDU67_009109 [Dinochytrium kinnereticum]|nr:hypothetical protein HDU67_009109 [Dinochytrium kinnereticum]
MLSFMEESENFAIIEALPFNGTPAKGRTLKKIDGFKMMSMFVNARCGTQPGDLNHWDAYMAKNRYSTLRRKYIFAVKELEKAQADAAAGLRADAGQDLESLRGKIVSEMPYFYRLDMLYRQRGYMPTLKTGAFVPTQQQQSLKSVPQPSLMHPVPQQRPQSQKIALQQNQMSQESIFDQRHQSHQDTLLQQLQPSQSVSVCQQQSSRPQSSPSISSSAELQNQMQDAGNHEVLQQFLTTGPGFLPSRRPQFEQQFSKPPSNPVQTNATASQILPTINTAVSSRSSGLHTNTTSPSALTLRAREATSSRSVVENPGATFSSEPVDIHRSPKSVWEDFDGDFSSSDGPNFQGMPPPITTTNSTSVTSSAARAGPLRGSSSPVIDTASPQHSVSSNSSIAVPPGESHMAETSSLISPQIPWTMDSHPLPSTPNEVIEPASTSLNSIPLSIPDNRTTLEWEYLKKKLEYDDRMHSRKVKLEEMRLAFEKELREKEVRRALVTDLLAQGKTLSDIKDILNEVFS